MDIRTTRKTLTFRHAFTLSHGSAPLPAGRYTLEIEEERLDGVTFTAHRRIAGHLIVDGGPGRPGLTEMIPVTEAEERQLLADDLAPTTAHGDGGAR